MKFVEFLDEVTSKDIERMKSLINKNSDGVGVAKTIKDKTKAIDRYVAGLKLTETELIKRELFKGSFRGVFMAFGNRALELGATYDEIKSAYDHTDINKIGTTEKEDEWVPKKKSDVHHSEQSINDYTRRDAPILPIGNVNLKTGANKFFNVYETWGEDHTYELWKCDGRGLRLVVTSGTKPLANIGTIQSFISDQSRRFLFNGELIDWATGSDLKRMAKTYGSSLPAYVYK